MSTGAFCRSIVAAIFCEIVTLKKIHKDRRFGENPSPAYSSSFEKGGFRLSSE
jgi:hypothetical protein